MKYKMIDLCAGIGGIRRGFELTHGFKNVMAAEIDPFAAKTYEHLYGEKPMADLTSQDFLDAVKKLKYDILLAGFPCQTFSRVGKMEGFEDATKGTIFFSIAKIISETRPKAVFLENVENLISHDKGRTIDTIIRTLEKELEYKVVGVTVDDKGNYIYSKKTFVRNSRYFGIPQNRPRAFIMAFDRKWYGSAVNELIVDLPEGNKKCIYKDINDLLETEVEDRYYMSEGFWETLKKHKQRQKLNGNGFGYCIVNQKPDLTANTILATGGSGKERNLIYQPKDGVAGKKVKYKKTKLNSEGIRVMTPTEWGRLQGFIGYAFKENEKEKFSFPDGISDGQKYKQFGNSVTIPVIEEMASFMLECFGIMNKYCKKKIIESLKKKEIVTEQECQCILEIPKSHTEMILKEMVQNQEIYKVEQKKSYYYIKCPGIKCEEV